MSAELNYNLVTVLAYGKFGTIQLCEFKGDKMGFIKKNIRMDLKSELCEKAKSCVEVLKRLRHPNVMRYYDYFTQSCIFSIVMEFAHRGTLAKFIYERRAPKLTPRTIAEIFCQILVGLNYLHSMEIIHGFLNPSNIYLCNGVGLTVKVNLPVTCRIMMEFGSYQTYMEFWKYSPPEHFRGEAPNFKSDIWALGCILLELCQMSEMYGWMVAHIAYSQTRQGESLCKPVDTKICGEHMQKLINLLTLDDRKARPDTYEIMRIPYVSHALFGVLRKLC